MEPLANRIRPQSLEGFVGQRHLVGAGKPLRLALEQGHAFSFALWGPPGTGKTTLARIYANAINAQLYDEINIDTLKETLQSKFLRYDKKGEEHYNVISAFIKSMRASKPDAAIYYLARMIESGEDPKFIARRMVIFASEDIGLAQPTA